MQKIMSARLNYKTKKFNLQIFYKSRAIKAKEIIVDKNKFAGMCRTGCSGYRSYWSCPPYSPSCKDIKKGFKNIFVYTAYIKTNQIKISNPYLVLFNIYNILAPKMHECGMTLEKELKGLLLKSGPCRICKICSASQNKKCRCPERRRYALESTGVDVQKLAKKLNHELLWYNNKKLPEYSSIVCGVLTNEKVSQKKAYDDFKKNFISKKGNNLKGQGAINKCKQ